MGDPDQGSGVPDSPAASDPARRVALAVAAVGLLAFGVITALLVPWDPAGGPLRLPSPTELFTPAEIARAESYSRGARLTSWAALAVSLVVVLWLALSRTGRRLGSRVAGRLPGPWWVQTVLAVVAVTVVVRLATLPFAVVAQTRRRSYGLSTQGWAGWARDVATNTLLSIVVTAVVALGADRLRAPLAARLARRGRNDLGCPRAAGLVRLPGGGRAPVQLLRAVAGRPPAP